MNNHHEIISVHSVSRLKYEGNFFQEKAIYGKTNFYGQICRRGVILHEGTNDQIHAKWGVGREGDL